MPRGVYDRTKAKPVTTSKTKAKKVAAPKVTKKVTKKAATKAKPAKETK
jgi:hypothetical protein